MVDKRVPSKVSKARSFWRGFNDRLPFLGAIVLTALVTIWVGLTLNFLFTPRKTVTPAPLSPAVQSPNPSPAAAVPPWLQQTAPLPTEPLPGAGTTIVSSAPPAPVPQNPPVAASAANSPAGFPLPQARYGHLPYLEADPSQLVGHLA